MPDDLKPDPSQYGIDVWLTYYQDIAGTALPDHLRDYLDDTERAREQRFHFADDRLCYLVTRAMVRTVLSRYAAIAPKDWIFSANAYGRPQIANRNDDAAGLNFNISHTRGLIALAVSRRGVVGIDVEHIRSHPVPVDIADQFLSPAEAAALATVPAEQRPDRFFEYWTFKESYIKARGMGLSLPLKSFSVHLQDERAVTMTVDPASGDDGNRWCFHQYRPTAHHLLAVCAERIDGRSPVLSLRTTVPTVRDDMVGIPISRSSETERNGPAQPGARSLQNDRRSPF